MVEILTDHQRKAEQVCQEGIDLANEKDLEGAHKVFQHAYEMDPTNARIQSWYGYTTGMVERKVQKGMDLCRKAVESNIPDALFYRNIGMLYLQLNNKRAAIGAFAKGLQIDKGNRAIMAEWNVLGFRRKQFFSFVDRSHWLNKMVGKLTWRFTHRNDKSS